MIKGLFGINIAVKDLDAGEYTQVIDTDQGLQIFQVQERVNARNMSLEEASAQIEETLYKEKVNEKYADWMEDLRARSHIKIVQ